MRRPLVARASLGRGRCSQTPDLCQGKPVQAPSAARSRVVFLTSAALTKKTGVPRVEGYAGQCLGAYARSLLMCRPDNLLIACLRPTPRFARVIGSPDDCRRIAEAPAALFSLAEAEATLEPGEPQGHRGLPPRARALRKRCQVSAHPPRLTTTLASTDQHLDSSTCMSEPGSFRPFCRARASHGVVAMRCPFSTHREGPEAARQPGQTEGCRNLPPEAECWAPLRRVPTDRAPPEKRINRDGLH